MNIAIFYGGKSSEHEVSLLSATSVVRNIDLQKHTVNLIGITKQGRMYLQSANELKRVKSDENAVLTVSEPQDMVVAIIPGGGTDGGIIVLGSEFGAKNIPVDCAFPVLHGTFGEDGAPQGLLEMAGIPYVGGGVMASAIAMDKEKTKQIWQQEGLPIVPYVCLHFHEYEDEEKKAESIKTIERDFTYPVFVKPCCAGSSVGSSKAEDRKDLERACAEAFAWDSKILVEPFIPSREIECSVVGNDEVTAYTPGEIATTHSFYDYDAKYTDPDGADLLIPANLEDARLRDIRLLAMKAYRALNLTGLSRVDFFIDKKTDKLYLNEVNTIPGFTSISMFAKMCASSGLQYPALIEKLLALAVERAESRRGLKTSR